MSNPRVLIVAEHASAQFGGEAILPLHFYRRLRRRGIEAWLIVHARTQAELSVLMPEEQDRIIYIPDTVIHRLLFLLGKPLPHRIRSNATEFFMALLTEWLARRIGRRLIREQHIDVVHQPIPVSPKRSSLMYKMGAPVIIGPMNGGMSFPEAFRAVEGRAVRVFMRVGRWASRFVNMLMPGKRRAETLLVANKRTRRALPEGVRGQVIDLVENGVDLDLWQPVSRSAERSQTEPVHFGFAGRLVDWKAVDILLEAFKGVADKHRVHLDIIGSGPEEPKLRALAEQLGIKELVTFHGWKKQPEAAPLLRALDVFVLTSLYECGGAVVLEAMATGLPVVAPDWGGPADYLDATCGILVRPTTRAGFIADLTRAMSELAASPEKRQSMGTAGRERAVKEFDWERKIDRILEIYAETIERAGGEARRAEGKRMCDTTQTGTAAQTHLTAPTACAALRTSSINIPT
jgi:glycosyltransferase involved in cell wall biosynthesis